MGVPSLSELDEFAVSVSSFGEPESVFDAVLAPTFQGSVVHVGGPAISDPFGDVIDLAARGADVAADVLAPFDHQFQCLSGTTGEQATLPAEVDHHPVRVEYHTPDMRGECSLDDVASVDPHTVVGL